MSEKHDDGGPACPQRNDGDWIFTGMTLWDYYCGDALRYCRGGDYGSFADLAHDCANIADAMIAERRARGIGK